jgi:hypothetical protein
MSVLPDNGFSVTLRSETGPLRPRAVVCGMKINQSPTMNKPCRQW